MWSLIASAKKRTQYSVDTESVRNDLNMVIEIFNSGSHIGHFARTGFCAASKAILVQLGHPRVGSGPVRAPYGTQIDHNREKSNWNARLFKKFDSIFAVVVNLSAVRGRNPPEGDPTALGWL